MKNALFLLFALVSILGFSQDNPIEVPMIGTKLALGETVQFENATVKFIKVLEDSRCPKEVTCIWAGQARLLVEVTEKGKDSKEMELLFDGKTDNILYEIEENEDEETEGYYLRGISLLPYPVSDTESEIEYVLLVSEGEQ